MKKKIFKKLLCLCIAVTLIAPVIYTPGAKVEASTSGAEGRSFTADELYCVKQPYESEILTYEASIWIPTALTKAGGVIVGTRGGAENCYSLEIDADGNPHLYLQTDSDTFVDYEFADVNVKTGKWIHLAVVKDASASKLYCYVDGVQKQELELTDATSIIPDVAAVVGGDYTEGNTNYFKGHIRDIKLYPEARTAEEIVSDMNSLNEAELEQMEEITFSNFGANVPGTYAYDSAKPNNYQANSGIVNLENKMLRGTITFSGDKTRGIYIGNAAVPKWLKLFYNNSKTNDETSLWLEIAGKEVIITQEKAGVPLVNTAVDFGLSYQRVDSNNDGNKDQLKLGIWINGNLYDNQYVYVDGFEDGSEKYTDYVEKAAIYVSRSQPGVSVTLANAIAKPDEELEEITFSKFGADVPGQYTTPGTDGVIQFQSGVVNLEDKMLKGSITLGNAVANGIYIGNSAATETSIKWLKLFYNYSKTNDETSLWLEIAKKEVIITQEKAGVPLVNTAVDFGLSYQRVDSNNDGNKDQLKLGIWIDGKLYDNQYIYVDGFEDGSAKYTNYIEKAAIYGGGSRAGVSITLADVEITNEEIIGDLYLADFDFSGTETDAALVKVIACNDITQYRTETAKNAPTDITPSGYIFAGWYKDAMCKTSVGKDEIGTQGTTYYAKFVNAKIWKVQAQIDSKTTASSTSTTMRFLTTIDSLQYQQAGFYVDKGDESKATKTVHKTAYRKLQALGFDYTPETISNASTYFIALTISGIPQADFSKEIGIRPYWITKDGTEVIGARETKSVAQGL